MLFQKKIYLDWEQYNKIVDNIEHWCFMSDQFRYYWGDLKWTQRILMKYLENNLDNWKLMILEKEHLIQIGAWKMVYNKKYLGYLHENDSISGWEEGFMQGYLDDEEN